MYDEFSRCNMMYILVRREQLTVYMADDFGWVGRKSGVCFATSCLGATNILTGIASPCRFCPMITITGQVPVAMIGRDTFQGSDIIGIKLFHNLYKYACAVAKIQRSMPTNETCKTH